MKEGNKIYCKQFKRAFISGSLSYLAHLQILIFFSEILNNSKVVGNVIGFLAGVGINFIGYKFWVLPTKGHLYNQLSKFYLLNFFALLLHTSLFYFLLEIQINYIIAQSSCSLLIFTLSFLISKRTIFKSY